MVRVIVDLSWDQYESLERACEAAGISRDEGVRRAVERYLSLNLLVEDDEAFGVWREREIDSLNYQEKLRSEWTG